MSISNDTKKQQLRWIPLESNPEILNKMIHNHGVDCKWGFIDIYGFDDDALAVIPRPATAIIFLFPGSPAYDEFRAKDEARLALNKQAISDNVIHFKQTIENACGMIALLHSLSNNRQINGDGLFKRIFDATREMTYDKRGEYLESCSELANLHHESACSGQSYTPDIADPCSNHYISFVEVDGEVYELDGGRPLPVNHGKCNDFIQDTAKIMQSFIERDPEFNEYSAIALAKLKE
ncbi:DnaJ-like protein xdj1 [Mucor velutinosus]|uniref:Ubiquitin carboxyl-terminal hydrolase n=1 Tax=Mucor velutinosus TaxID=708070 RepID=A0AAN7DE81_9FUNG|nr:DnaJ-like protein xdj1 [Mucor velutinosus]